MAPPHLAFCPYLPMHEVVKFADWELGPLKAFEDRWGDPAFEAASKSFLGKFVDGVKKKIENPSLLCRRNDRIEGQLPSKQEIEAVETAIAFAFLDKNPRRLPSDLQQAWNVLTADNTELYFWPIDIAARDVTVRTGLMVRTLWGGYQIDDPKLVIRPPLDLHMPGGLHTADAKCLEAVYKTVLLSLQTPGENGTADQIKTANRIRTAIRWFVKAWRNTETVQFPERVVFLKTAFEALTGTSKSCKSASFLRELFEAVPDTSAEDSELLVWSPAEKPIYEKKGKQCTAKITDLELWFMKFADARNTIIHQEFLPPLDYEGSNTAYNGHFVFTAEFLLRAVVKVSLGKIGYPDLWRSAIWRAVNAACEQLEARKREPGQDISSSPA